MRTHRGERDWICLDPSDPESGHLARVVHYRGTRPIFVRALGTLDPQRCPHVLVAALARMAIPDDVLIQWGPYRQSPTMRQTLQLVAEMIRPDTVLAPAGSVLPFPYEEVELEAAMTSAVRVAQRKANWIALRESSEAHVIELRDVAVEGVRLRSGVVMDERERSDLGLDRTLYAERQGSVLFAVAEDEPDELAVSRALDVTGCRRAVFVPPDGYDGLLCALARRGEEIGFGVIERVDWSTLRMHVSADAIPPAPLDTLRIGSLRIDPDGNELGEIRAWQV